MVSFYTYHLLAVVPALLSKWSTCTQRQDHNPRHNQVIFFTPSVSCISPCELSLSLQKKECKKKGTPYQFCCIISTRLHYKGNEIQWRIHPKTEDSRQTYTQVLYSCSFSLNQTERVIFLNRFSFMFTSIPKKQEWKSRLKTFEREMCSLYFDWNSLSGEMYDIGIHFYFFDFTLECNERGLIYLTHILYIWQTLKKTLIQSKNSVEENVLFLEMTCDSFKMRRKEAESLLFFNFLASFQSLVIFEFESLPYYSWKSFLMVTQEILL